MALNQVIIPFKEKEYEYKVRVFHLWTLDWKIL